MKHLAESGGGNARGVRKPKQGGRGASRAQESDHRFIRPLGRPGTLRGGARGRSGVVVLQGGSAVIGRVMRSRSRGLIGGRHALTRILKGGRGRGAVVACACPSIQKTGARDREGRERRLTVQGPRGTPRHRSHHGGGSRIRCSTVTAGLVLPAVGSEPSLTAAGPVAPDGVLPGAVAVHTHPRRTVIP